MRNTVAVLLVLLLIRTLTVGETTEDQNYAYIVQDGAVLDLPASILIYGRRNEAMGSHKTFT